MPYRLLRLRNYDPKIVLTLRAGAVEVFEHGWAVLSFPPFEVSIPNRVSV